MTSTTPTIRFSSPAERKHYEVGLAIVAAKKAAGKATSERNLTAAKLGVAPDVVSSVVAAATKEALTGYRALSAKRKVVKAAKPTTAPVRQASAKPTGTIHKFSTNFHRITNHGGLFG